jgi:hypothetical protein
LARAVWLLAVVASIAVLAGCFSGDEAPADADRDGIVDTHDNSPRVANAPRVDLTGDGALDHRDQLDNDLDGRGDAADPDDDDDTVPDGEDLCPLVADRRQRDVDRDALGDACDPLDDRDSDRDGVPDGPRPGDPLHEAARAAKAKWASGRTHFVIRIDALARFFQNEFTQLMTDAAILSPAEWDAKCGENYADPEDPPDPCGPGPRPTLPGGKEVPITLVVIPSRLWADPGVIRWINDRNDSDRLEIAQHGTYHANDTPHGDWRTIPEQKTLSCEICGLTQAESFALMKIGRDALAGAGRQSPRIDWARSALPLLTFAPPFNASDPAGRGAVARLRFPAFSASVFEEESSAYGQIFTPEETHHERFDQFGMFHVSADVELEPPETENGLYDRQRYADYLAAQTNEGGLTTWLIEEVEWSGRPCNEDDRLETCAGRSNRENNTVHRPRWLGWMQLLDFVNSYPDSVVLTAGEVALALAYDNARTVANPDQADADHDGVGDVIDRP